MTDQKKTGTRRYKKRLRKGREFFSLVLIFFLMASCFAAGMRIYNRFFRPRSQVAETKQESLTTEGFSNRINVLLLGTDDGDSEDFGKDTPKRTDAMLLVSFDPENSQVSVLSLPRDTRVTIPGRRGHDKINAAYAYGGVNLAKRTVANLLQVPVNHYMQVDWQGFIKVVDMLGGVDLDVEQDMDYEDPYADLKIHLKKGKQHLNGGTATDYVKTDMDFIQMVKAANCLRLFGEGGVKSASLKGDFGDIGGVSYWVTTPSKIAATLDELKIPHKRIPSI